MKQILKIFSTVIVALVTLAGTSSCNKDNSVGYHFEYSNVSFDTVNEYPISPETRFNTLKTQLETMLNVASDEATIINMADGQIAPANHNGINATITLKKGNASIKEWTLTAINKTWNVVPDDPAN